MKRLLIATGITVAALTVATPAVASLSGNPSFSHKLPVRVPSSAQVVKFDDHGVEVSDRSDSQSSRHESRRATSSPSPSATSTRRAGDDHGVDPNDDRSGTATSEPGDDNGVDRRRQHRDTPAATSDDHGNASPTRSAEPGDDKPAAGRPTGNTGHPSGRHAVTAWRLRPREWKVVLMTSDARLQPFTPPRPPRAPAAQ